MTEMEVLAALAAAFMLLLFVFLMLGFFGIDE